MNVKYEVMKSIRRSYVKGPCKYTSIMKKSSVYNTHHGNLNTKGLFHGISP